MQRMMKASWSDSDAQSADEEAQHEAASSWQDVDQHCFPVQLLERPEVWEFPGRVRIGGNWKRSEGSRDAHHVS